MRHMKIHVFALPVNKKHKKEIEDIIKQDAHFTLTTKPEVVISIGGDGTFLAAERKFPGIPKILYRQSTICNKCGDSNIHTILKHLKQRRFSIQKINKLEATIGKKKLLAINDIIIRNKHIQQALRFTITTSTTNNKEIVGDGLVIATPYGSTAYFHAITKTSFSKGIGVAFNNPIINIPPIITTQATPIKITIIREEALIAADNDPTTLTIKPQQTITIKAIKQQAKIIHL